MEISVKYLQSQNYAPSDVMAKWGKENNKKFSRDEFFRSRLEINGKMWIYDSWKICKHEDGTETVILKLLEA